VHARQSPLDNGFQDGAQSATLVGEAVFNSERHDIVLPAVNEPALLQVLQLTAQPAGSDGFPHRAFEQ
jgi:hypothetical protein